MIPAMSAFLNFFFMAIILLAPFALVAVIATVAKRHRTLHLHAHQFRLSGPLMSHLFDDDADARRISHDLDAVRTRFEHHPTWPSSGALGERR